MQLKELVPPPEVCVKIPIGEFKDSFAVYLVTAVNMDKPFDISKQCFELMPRFAAKRKYYRGFALRQHYKRLWQSYRHCPKHSGATLMMASDYGW